MKIIINVCYGGFSLSPAAVKRYAELTGRECYFFKNHYENGKMRLQPVSLEECNNTLLWSAYDIPNPDQALPSDESFHSKTLEERQAHNQMWEDHSLPKRDLKRDDPLLIQIVEELGAGHRTGASGVCASLKVVEIPDGVEWEIQEYDGNEWVAEVHRTWS